MKEKLEYLLNLNYKSKVSRKFWLILNKIFILMVDIKALSKELKQSLNELYGEKLADLILFGSYARGDFHKHSDVDFMVVLKDNDIKFGEEIIRIGDILNNASLKYGVSISAKPTTLQKIKESNLFFYRNIRKDGIKI